MGLPYNGRDNGPAKHLMPPSKTLSARNELSPLESFTKGVTQTSQVISKAIVPYNLILKPYF